MTGFQEILIIVGIVLGIFFLPRMMSKKPAPRRVRPKLEMSGKMRMAVAASVLHPLLCAAFFKPWQQAGLFVFIYIGVAPVVVGWLAAWVFVGFNKRR